jgi:phenylalanyl-tRNA synthetase alpha chain
MRARVAPKSKGARSEEELESLRLKYLGKKGEVTALLKSVGTMPPAVVASGVRRGGERGQAGDSSALLGERKEVMELASIKERVETRETIDVTLPGVIRNTGGLHPLTRVAPGDPGRVLRHWGSRCSRAARPRLMR